MISSSSRGDFTDPEYDLEDIKNAIETDSYIKMALYKYDTLIFKPNTIFRGVNENAVAYIKSRLRIMSFACSKPFMITLQEVGQDLNHFHNAFLIKSRVDKLYGGIQAKGVLDNKPIGGYFRVDPWTMKVKMDNNGAISGYEQEVDGETKTYKNTDVIHFYLDKRGSNIFGTPRILPALEDVKLLRKLESNILVLIYRFAMPIYQWIVGLIGEGKGATASEIDELKREIERMTMEGSIVTGERVQIKTIGAEGEALDANGYLSYFEKRVFSALGSSESQMGRGGAKQDADSMEQLAHNIVKHVQKILSIFIDECIINELLLEGGFNPLINEQDIVNFVFEEINTETSIKKENNIVNKFNANLITIDEARLAIGMVSQPDEARLSNNMFDKTDDNGVVATVDNANQPTNQYGKTSAKVKEFSAYNITKKKYSNIYSKWDQMVSDILNGETKELVIPASKNVIQESIMREIMLSSREGSLKAITDAQRNDEMISNIELGHFAIYINDTLKNILKGLLKENTKESFRSEEFRFRCMLEYIIPKSYWYSYVKTCSHIGINSVKVKFDSEKDLKEHRTIIHTNNFSMSDIPAFHSFCKCSVYVETESDKGGEEE